MEIAPACLKWPQNSLRGQMHMHIHKGVSCSRNVHMINFSDRCWPRRLRAKRDLTPSPRKLIILRAGGVTSRVQVAYKRPEAPKTPPGRLSELQLGRRPTAWHLGPVTPGVDITACVYVSLNILNNRVPRTSFSCVRSRNAPPHAAAGCLTLVELE